MTIGVINLNAFLREAQRGIGQWKACFWNSKIKFQFRSGLCFEIFSRNSKFQMSQSGSFQNLEKIRPFQITWFPKSNLVQLKFQKLTKNWFALKFLQESRSFSLKQRWKNKPWLEVTRGQLCRYDSWCTEFNVNGSFGVTCLDENTFSNSIECFEKSRLFWRQKFVIVSIFTIHNLLWFFFQIYINF